MAKGRFDFKQFTVLQDINAMKVGTDAVLLGSWMDVSGSARMLDVGTGTGVIALMAAQRACGAEVKAKTISSEGEQVEIIAIEIDEPSAQEAAFNFSQSPWSENLQAFCVSLDEYAARSDVGKFDLIFSNPPFFSQKVCSPDERREIARRVDALPIKSLISSALTLLSNHGRIAVIYPYNEGAQFVMEAVEAGLYLHRQCFIKGAEGRPAKRVLIEMGRDLKQIATDELVIGSDRYNLLTESFYLSK